MTTALDTNILSAVFNQEANAETLAWALLEAQRTGPLVICGATYAELLSNPNLPEATLVNALTLANVGVDWTLDEAIWRAAGQASKGYTVRRRSSGGDFPRRLLADFVIGAHASLRADALMTLDPQHYRLSFPDLKLIVL